MITLTEEKFYTNKTWEKPVMYDNPGMFKNYQWVELFDQNGYRLTPLEQEYSLANNQRFIFHRDEKTVRKLWMTDEKNITGPHINHAFLFERKGYSGEALEQLKRFAKVNPLVNKLVNYKGKWGVDLSIDYVDEIGNSMEILHFEYDGYELDEIQEMKSRIETSLTAIDWSLAAKDIIRRKSEWIDLEFFQQSKWKTDYFGLPSERFKILAWE